MKSQLRQQAVDLRIKQDLSYGEIRKKLGVSKSTLSYWLREYPLKEERIFELRQAAWKKGEASRERFRNTMRNRREDQDQEVYKKQLKRLSQLSSDAFFAAGLMLYAAEGSKKDYTKVILANTDVRIIKFFIHWLVRFFRVQEEKLKATLHLYENMDIKKEKGFWKNELGFADSQFYKPQIRKLRKSSFSYKESYRHGTCSLYIGGVVLHREIAMAIRALLDSFENI